MKRSHIEIWLDGLETSTPPSAPESNKRRRVAPLRSTQPKADKPRYSLRSLRPITRQQIKMAGENKVNENSEPRRSTRKKATQQSSENANTRSVEGDDTRAQQRDEAQPQRRRVGRPPKNPPK